VEFGLEHRHLVVELGEAFGLGGVIADEVLCARTERRGLAYRAVERGVDVGDVGACRASSARISALAPNPAHRNTSCTVPLAIPLAPTPNMMAATGIITMRKAKATVSFGGEAAGSNAAIHGLRYATWLLITMDRFRKC
jgi:hypothetical protein